MLSLVRKGKCFYSWNFKESISGWTLCTLGEMVQDDCNSAFPYLFPEKFALAACFFLFIYIYIYIFLFSFLASSIAFCNLPVFGGWRIHTTRLT